MLGIETMLIGIYLAVVNLVAFVAYGIDKRRARRGDWRIPERTLLALGFVGGGLGAFLGMRVFHHKTRKLRFRLLVPLTLVLTLVAGGSALYFSDYYHADAVAMAAAASSEGIEVRSLDGGALAFVPAEPVVGMVFYPGAKVQPEAYAPLLRACAQRGMLCVLVRPPLNFSLLDVSAAEDAIQAFPEMQTWILAGHSLGGVAAAAYAADNLQDIDAMVFLASYPAADLSALDGPTLSVVGSEDQVLNRDAYSEAWTRLPVEARELVIEGGNHAQFGNYGKQRGDGVATIAREDQQAQTVDAIASLVSELQATP